MFLNSASVTPMREITYSENDVLGEDGPHWDYWPCACTKRKNGVATHIKTHHRSVARCKQCGAERPAFVRAVRTDRPTISG